MNVETCIKGNESQNDFAPASSLQNQTDRTHKLMNSLSQKSRNSSPKKNLSLKILKDAKITFHHLCRLQEEVAKTTDLSTVFQHTDTLQVNTRYSKQLNTCKKS